MWLTYLLTVALTAGTYCVCEVEGYCTRRSTVVVFGECELPFLQYVYIRAALTPHKKRGTERDKHLPENVPPLFHFIFLFFFPSCVTN